MLTYKNRDSTKEFAILQGPDPASGPMQTGPCADVSMMLYTMRDADLDPQSLLEQETTWMSNSAVQRKKDAPVCLYKYLC